MPTSKSKKTKGRTQLRDLPKKEKALSATEAKKVKGGILPYIEQDNIYKLSNIKDGTSNTIIGSKTK